MLRTLLLTALVCALSAPSLAQRASHEAGVPATAVYLPLGATAATVGLGVVLFTGTEEPATLAAGLGLLVLGSALGPSAGSFYLGDTTRGWVGTGLRTAGLGLAAGGVEIHFRQMNRPDARTGEYTIYAGLALLTLGTVYSFATLPQSARGQEVRFGLAPGPEGGGAVLPSLVVRF